MVKGTPDTQALATHLSICSFLNASLIISPEEGASGGGPQVVSSSKPVKDMGVFGRERVDGKGNRGGCNAPVSYASPTTYTLPKFYIMSDGRDLLAFKAGRAFRREGTNFVDPSPTKGAISLQHGEDGLLHFLWRNRTTNEVDEVHTLDRLFYLGGILIPCIGSDPVPIGCDIYEGLSVVVGQNLCPQVLLI